MVEKARLCHAGKYPYPMQIGSWRIPIGVLIALVLVVLALIGGTAWLISGDSPSPTKTTTIKRPIRHPFGPGGTKPWPNKAGQGLLIGQVEIRSCTKSGKKCHLTAASRTNVRLTPVDSKEKANGSARVVLTNTKGMLRVALAPGQYRLTSAKAHKLPAHPFIVTVSKETSSEVLIMLT